MAADEAAPSCAELPERRLIHVAAEGLRELGLHLGQAYAVRVLLGFQRSMQLYVLAQPETLNMQQWQSLAERARRACARHCPAATAFFDGVDEVFAQASGVAGGDPLPGRVGRAAAAAARFDVWLALLDFELFSMEVRRAAADSSSSSSDDSDTTSADSERKSSSSSSSSRGGGSPKLSPSGRCTGVAVADGRGGAMAGQTVDLPPSLYAEGDNDVVLRLCTAAGAGCLAYDVDGRLCPIGLNSAGLAVCNFCLQRPHAEAYRDDAEPALSLQTVVWELLLGQHTVQSAREWLQGLPQGAVTCGGALLLCDVASGAVTVELGHHARCAPHAPIVGAPLMRSNHPLPELPGNAGWLQRAVCDGGDATDFSGKARSSRRRLRALQRHWREREGVGELSAERCAALLAADRKVRHSATLAVVACDPARRQLVVEYRERDGRLPVGAPPPSRGAKRPKGITRRAYRYALSEDSA